MYRTIKPEAIAVRYNNSDITVRYEYSTQQTVR